MKKIVAVLALAVSTAASAQLVGIASYDAAGVSATGQLRQEIGLGLKTTVKGFGVEGLVTGDFRNAGGQPTSNGEGFELAGSKSFTLGSWTPTLRLGTGRKLYENTHLNYYVVDATVARPLTSNTDLVLGYRFRNGFKDSDMFRSNRGTIGVNYKLTKTTTVGAAYAHTAGEGYITNGVVATVNYAF